MTHADVALAVACACALEVLRARSAATNTTAAQVLLAYVGTACGGFAFVRALERGSDLGLLALAALLTCGVVGLYAVARLAWTSR